MSVSDIEEQIQEMYGFEEPRSTISRIANAVTNKMVAWQNRPYKEAFKAALEDFAKKWESKYGYAIKSWYDNRDELTVFFDFPLEIRKNYIHN